MARQVVTAQLISRTRGETSPSLGGSATCEAHTLPPRRPFQRFNAAVLTAYRLHPKIGFPNEIAIFDLFFALVYRLLPYTQIMCGARVKGF
jgi:hypothetical protein